MDICTRCGGYDPSLVAPMCSTCADEAPPCDPRGQRMMTRESAERVGWRRWRWTLEEQVPGGGWAHVCSGHAPSRAAARSMSELARQVHDELLRLRGRIPTEAS